MVLSVRILLKLWYGRVMKYAPLLCTTPLVLGDGLITVLLMYLENSRYFKVMCAIRMVFALQ